jgi:AcrR family transcriptional regulator
VRTRDRILETARNLFNDEGLAQVSTNRIATELDISPGNLHYHFKKKEVLVAWLLRRLTESLRPFADSHESVEAIEDLWMTMHLALEVIDQYRFILRDVDFLVREYPALVVPLRELVGRRIAAMRAVLEKLRGLQVIDATDEQLTALVLQAVLANTAWHSFENLLPVGARGSVSGTRAVAYHLLVMLSPYVNEASRPYLDYLRGRYAT